MKRAITRFVAGLLLVTALDAAPELNPAAAQAEGVTAMAYGTVNVRSGPGTQYDIVGQLAAGDKVPVDGRNEDGDWLHIILTFGQNGWVAAFAVLVEGNILELPVTSPAAEDNGEDVTVTAYGVVNVRSGPGMNFPITAQLDAGDTLTVLGRSGTSNDWLYVSESDIEGWVAYFTVTLNGSADGLPIFTVDGSGEVVVPENSVVRTRFNVRLRASASLSAAVLEVVPFNSLVRPLARTAESDWLYVLYQQTAGWGLAQLFDISDEQLAALPLYNVTVLTPTPTTSGGR
ncbi:MAG: SH3 domain-containing protein [Chloroflexi bacterium]|nr:SH3 domain-containing protein [Chloroflexota bacterium]